MKKDPIRSFADLDKLQLPASSSAPAQPVSKEPATDQKQVPSKTSPLQKEVPSVPPKIREEERLPDAVIAERVTLDALKAMLEKQAADLARREDQLRTQSSQFSQERQISLADIAKKQAALAARTAQLAKEEQQWEQQQKENYRRKHDLDERSKTLDCLAEQLNVTEQALQKFTEEQRLLKERQLACDEAAMDELRRHNLQLCDEIVELRDAVESHEEIAEEERQKRAHAERQALDLRSELAREMENLQNLKRMHQVLKESMRVKDAELRKANEDNASAKRENGELKVQNRAIDQQLIDLRQAHKRLESENRELHAKASNQRPSVQIAAKTDSGTCFPCGPLDWDLVRAFSDEVTELFEPPAEMVSIGSGPFPEDEFDEYLGALGITPYTNGCSWIIVGRDGWTEEQLNELIEDADLDEVRVFSQELFIAAILTAHNPFSMSVETLMRFAEGHPALEYLIGSGFEWPELVFEEDFGEPVYLRGSCERVEESPLYRMGYQVGVTHGQTKSRRRSLLRSAYHGAIPPVEDDDYMEEWGKPHQSKRLWRIAHHIAWLVRSRKSIYSMRYAVTDWMDDLDWLEKEFYTNRMRFSWPNC